MERYVPINILQRNRISSVETSPLSFGSAMLTFCSKAYIEDDLVQQDKETLLLDVLFIPSVENSYATVRIFYFL